MTVASAEDLEIHKKFIGSGIFGSCTTTQIIPNEGMDDVIKKFKSLEGFGPVLKDIAKIIESKTKKQIS